MQTVINKKARRRPTLPQITCSTIGANELNFRVRDGNGCDLIAVITRLVEYSDSLKKCQSFH